VFDQWLSGSLHDNRVDLMLVEHSIYLLSHAPMKFISLYIEKVFGLQPSVDVSQIVIRTAIWRLEAKLKSVSMKDVLY